MREIKFRAWDNSKMWSEVNVGTGRHPYYSVYDTSTPVNKWIKCSGEVELMQFTGLKDKNGVEIYEGDIITVTTNHVADLDPKYPEKTTTVEVRCENAVWWFGDMTMIYTPLKNAKLEVIGNIYENKDLI